MLAGNWSAPSPSSSVGLKIADIGYWGVGGGASEKLGGGRSRDIMSH